MKFSKMLTTNVLVMFLCFTIVLLSVACSAKMDANKEASDQNSPNDSKEIVMPKKMLKDYTLSELQNAARNLSDQNVLSDYRYFMLNGITRDGSDNATKQIEDNHWAIDDNGKTPSEDDFGVNANVYEFRIVGVNQDGESTLTFMATHSLVQTCQLEQQESEGYKYGWAGPTEDGMCTMQKHLQSGVLPKILEDAIKPVDKIYGVSLKVDPSLELTKTATNKIWLPSIHELTGIESTAYKYYSKEGEYYEAFKSVDHVFGKYGALKNIGKNQSGDKLICENVWERSVADGRWNRGICINTEDGLPFIGDGADHAYGVCPCFCL